MCWSAGTTHSESNRPNKSSTADGGQAKVGGEASEVMENLEKKGIIFFGKQLG